MPRPDGRRLRRCLVGAWSRREILPRLLAIALNWRRPGLARGEGPADRDEDGWLPEIPFRLAAFGAGRNSFPRELDGRVRNRDGQRSTRRWNSWTAGRWRGRDSRG